MDKWIICWHKFQLHPTCTLKKEENSSMEKSIEKKTNINFSIQIETHLKMLSRHTVYSLEFEGMYCEAMKSILNQFH